MNFNKYEKDFYIFTDGSFHKEKNQYKFKKNENKKKDEDNKISMISKFGIYFGMKTINISHEEKNSTNNQCELLAIKYTLIVLDKYKKQIREYQKTNPDNIINIVSDSQYCIKALMIWIDKQLQNNWKTQLDEPVKNKEIFISINLIMSKLKLHKIRYKFIHFNSHQPPPLSNDKELFLWKGNQLADYLAKDYNYK